MVLVTFCFPILDACIYVSKTFIITSYDSNDYYNEGHSFFRSRVTDAIQDIPVQNSIDYKNQPYLIAHCAIYYGNSFETELDDLDYQYFDMNTVSINTSVYHFYRLPLIHEFYLNNLKLNNQPASDQADAILYHSLSNGWSYKVGGGSILTLCPPLTINNDELTHAFNIIENGINSLD